MAGGVAGQRASRVHLTEWLFASRATPQAPPQTPPDSLADAISASREAPALTAFPSWRLRDDPDDVSSGDVGALAGTMLASFGHKAPHRQIRLSSRKRTDRDELVTCAPCHPSSDGADVAWTQLFVSPFRSGGIGIDVASGQPRWPGMCQ